MSNGRSIIRTISTSLSSCPGWLSKLLLISVFAGLISPTAGAETYVSGEVSGTWHRSGSPFIVIETIEVAEGSSLLIESGVELLFNPGQGFNVYGLLQAHGAESDSIIFTVHEGDDWDGIQFIAADDRSYLLYCAITKGRAHGDLYPAAGGGGIYLENSSPTISHCRIADCTAGDYMTWEDQGGGLYCIGGAPQILDCQFVNCRQNSCPNGGGAIFFQDTDIRMINNEIRECHAHGYGGGIRGESSQVDISHNVIRDCTVVHGYGGLLLDDCEGLFFNNLIIGNHVGDSSTGGMGLSNSDVDIISCTFAGNESWSLYNYGAGLMVSGCQPEVTNCIFWGNTIGDFPQMNQITPPDLAYVSYCNVQYGYPGYGNSNIDPLFVIEGDDPYFLSAIAAGQAANSPSIDAGTESAEYWLLAKLSTRTDYIPDSGTVDLGFHRYKLLTSALEDPPVICSNRLWAHPNPFSSSTTIRSVGELDWLSAGANDFVKGTLIASEQIKLHLYDASGRLVRLLKPDVRGGSGVKGYSWDGRDDSGVLVAPGIYFMRLGHHHSQATTACKVVVLR